MYELQCQADSDIESEQRWCECDGTYSMQWDVTTSECVTKAEFTQRCETNSFCFAVPAADITGYLSCRCTGLIIPEEQVSPAVVLKGDDVRCCKKGLARDDVDTDCVEPEVLQKRCEASYGGKIKEDEKCGGGAIYCKLDDKKLVLQR